MAHTMERIHPITRELTKDRAIDDGDTIDIERTLSIISLSSGTLSESSHKNA